MRRPSNPIQPLHLTYFTPFSTHPSLGCFPFWLWPNSWKMAHICRKLVLYWKRILTMVSYLTIDLYCLCLYKKKKNNNSIQGVVTMWSAPHSTVLNGREENSWANPFSILDHYQECVCSSWLKIVSAVLFLGSVRGPSGQNFTIPKFMVYTINMSYISIMEKSLYRSRLSARWI